MSLTSGMRDGTDEAWIRVQTCTFTRWVNSQLSDRKLKIESLTSDLQSGVILVQLLEIVSNKSIKHYAKPGFKLQMIENLNNSLQFLANEGIKVVNIGSEDIYENNLRLILGLIWTIILRFQINKGIEQGSPKWMLLEWVKQQVKPYGIPEPCDFKTSWVDGQTMSALADSLKPGTFPKSDWKRDPLTDICVAIRLSEDVFKIPQLMDAADMVDHPDELSIMTYVAQFRNWKPSQSPATVAFKPTASAATSTNSTSPATLHLTEIISPETSSRKSSEQNKVPSSTEPAGPTLSSTISSNFVPTTPASDSEAIDQIARLQAEVETMRKEREQAARLASEEAIQLRAELEALKLKAQQSNSLQPTATDFLSRLLIMTLDELEIEETSFAEGAFGNVHRGKYHGQQVAVKKLKRSADLVTLVKELKMWSRLTHPNIVQLMGYTEPPLAPMIVMELMEGSLFDVLHDPAVPLPLLRRFEMAYNLASGVSYLHAQQGVHRDIKSLNVLVRVRVIPVADQLTDFHFEVKLADFGTTRSLVSMSLTKAGSFRWHAPEMIKGQAASQASDVYAMGITFAEILTREIPYSHIVEDCAVVFAVVAGTRPQLWPPTSGMQELLVEEGLEKQTERFRRLIQQCCEENPERRPAAREVRVELASLIRELQHFPPSVVVAAPSSSSEPMRSIPIPLYTFGSSR